MKVLLVDPPWLFLEGKGLTRQVQPLGLGYVGAMLAPHHDVRILLPDTWAYVGDDPFGELAKLVAAEAPDVVGLTAVTAAYPAAVRLARLVKELDPAITVVLGGVHASDEPLSSLAGSTNIDFLVRGEGEQTMLELVAALEAHKQGRPFTPESVPGLYWRDAATGDIRSSTPRTTWKDVDALPFPMRDNLVLTRDIHPALYQALITLRGCPYQCIYCAVPNSQDRLTRYRSPASVVDEIALLRERYQVPSLFFHDSVFSLHRQRTLDICQLMMARGLTVPFHCQTRTDRVDPELLETMKAAGCEQIFFGIESGDAESLRRIKKRTPLDQIRQAVGWVKALDIRCTGFFMVGFPWEDEMLIQRTADFATNLGLDAISLFSATPLPGTELWRMAGGSHLPDSIDFRTPQVNLTQLSDDAYVRVFDRVKAQVEAHNEAAMMRRARAMLKGARLNWLDPEPPSANAEPERVVTP